MARPLVAIVGRPNVGKSTFFNRMCGKQSAIVEDTPGVTRDRIFGNTEWLNHKFTLIDTGGIEPLSEDIILKQMRRQAELAIEACDVILFFVDAKQGIVSADYQVAELLRKSDKPVIVVVNKVETSEDKDMFYDFYSLGIGELCSISSSQGLGFGDLLDEVVKHFPDEEDAEEENDVMHIAIVGKPNAGKSSLTNKIIGEERVIVSDIPGTTRDAIDTPFTLDGREYMIIDTAGMRKKGKIDDGSIERYSVIRSLAAVRRADVCIVLIDAKEGITEQDVKIAGYVHEEGKPVIIAVNKWDAVEKDSYTIEKYKKDLACDLAFMDYAPSIYISAKTGQRINKLFSLVDTVYNNSQRRITTGLLNDCLREAVTAVEPPSDRGRRLKIFYITQATCAPPTFVLFVNDTKLMHFSYLRYLENYFRKTFDFSGTPIRFIVRQRKEDK